MLYSWGFSAVGEVAGGAGAAGVAEEGACVAGGVVADAGVGAALEDLVMAARILAMAAWLTWQPRS